MDVHSENRLAGETSPYLRQHAHNPVDWYPWGEEALAKARLEDKPVLLSIGYSACHWCHVMAHESFEDEATAAVMNELFVNIKVDREERPDLDKIYQTAHQLLAQRGGGWPLTMFLTPDQVPFFGGTYFPPEPRFGMPAFKDLLRQVARFYDQHRDDVAQQNVSLLQALESFNGPVAPPGEVVINAAPLDGARRQMAHAFDAENGGFGGEPKFPHAPHLERLLRHWAATQTTGQADERAAHMAAFTLRKMARGGIYDQLGGGFYRYSVDGNWMIPHFEKMLYDNGPLLALYAEAWSATAEPLFERIAAETGQWVMREMQSPEGAYYATLDADSEGVEGKFYVWDRDEVAALLDEQEYAVASACLGLNKPPNFEAEWHLRLARESQEVASQYGLSIEAARAVLDGARQKLFAARQQRVRPGRDEKVLTAWNGLMVKGMAVAGLRLGRAEFIDSATRAVDFIRAHLWRDGRLLASYKDGQARLEGYLDDYVFLIDGILALLQARWRTQDLLLARDLAEAVLAHFEDRDAGGFFFTADDAEQLIQRPKTFADEALPSGNGVAALVLLRLGYLLGEARYLNAAERTLRAAWAMIGQAPSAHNTLLHAVEEYLYPPRIVVIRGDAAQVAPWQKICIESFVPRLWVLAIAEDETALPAALASRVPKGEITAYLCQGSVCSPPVTALEEFRRQVFSPAT